MKNKIKEVTAVNMQGTSRMTVGSQGITRIEDDSIEEEEIVLIRFKAFDKDGNIVKQFINLSVEVVYSLD